MRVSILVILGTMGWPGGDTPPAFPRTPPTAPAESPGTFRALGGFRMELIAAEPLVYDPVAAAYDEDGRLYLVEMSDYPHVDPKNDKPFTENTLDPPVGRLRLLTDTDDDGRFDASTVLADGLSWPTGVAVWKGGVFVAATPSIWYFRDADGDGRAEVREEVFRGFRKFNVQAVMNNLQWGLDHAIYGAASGNGGEVRPSGEPGGPAVSVLRKDFRFRPDTRAFEAISGGARFGNTFDDWGQRFVCDIRNPAEHVVLPAHYLARNPRLGAPRAMDDAALAGDAIPMFRISPPEPWREYRARRWVANGKAVPRSELVGAGFLTSSSGVTVYRGDAYPPEYRGSIVLGEVANNLIHREAVEPDGVTFRARRADEKAEFVASTDTWFRPVNFVHAPDGTLHVLDMYRETIEHPWSIPDDILASLDLRSGEDRGRIYRLAPPGFRPRPTPKLSSATSPELVALLDHPNAWHRDTAHRLLYERQDRAAIAPLRDMLRTSRAPLGRLHALRSLDGLNGLEDQDLLVALSDAVAGVREHAVALAEPRLGRSDSLRNRVVGLASDPAMRVRFQVAFTLGEIADPGDAVAGLATVARLDAEDPWARTAILSSSARLAGPLFETLAAEKGGGGALLRDLAGLVGAAGDLGATRSLLDSLAAGPMPTDDPDRLEEVLLGLGEGLARSAGRPTVRELPSVSPAATALLMAVLDKAARTAADAGADLARRERAVALLGQAEFVDARRALGPLLAPGEPRSVQLGAIRSLASFADPEVASLFLERWPALSPGPRSEVIARLLSRPAWTKALLAAVKSGTVPPAVVPPARRDMLLADRDPTIRGLALSTLGKATAGPRAEVYARYRPALDLPTDVANGERVFERQCMTCHKLGERGHAVGPNLASVARRTPEEVLLHVLDPNREASPEYLEYAVALDDGRVLSGLVAAESATSLTLRRAEGAEDVVLRANIESITGTGRSLMPEGQEAQITPAEMADLIAFVLGTQK